MCIYIHGHLAQVVREVRLELPLLIREGLRLTSHPSALLPTSIFLLTMPMPDVIVSVFFTKSAAERFYKLLGRDEPRQLQTLL